MGGFITLPGFFRQFPAVDTAKGPNDLQTVNLVGFTVAIWNIGCFASAMVVIFLGDAFGRKKLVFIGLTFLLIGEILQCASFKWGQLIAGRFIAGFGNGINCATMPAWQAECTKAHRRGTLLMISAGVTTAAGLTAAYWIDFGFAYLDPSSASWRVPIGLQVALILLAAALVVVMPESPR
jgi:MFS family permease